MTIGTETAVSTYLRHEDLLPGFVEDQPEEDETEGEDIDTGGVRLLLVDLRRHEGRRAYFALHLNRLTQVTVRRQSEVGQLYHQLTSCTTVQRKTLW